jgi:hypothetical protein
LAGSRRTSTIVKALTENDSLTAAPHPEEMKARVKLRIGSNVVLHATARTTPAGLISAGLAVSSIILAVAALVWAVRRPALAKPI